jgi:hypothetical protein
LLSVHANFSNSDIPYLKLIFNGSYPDFTLEWYYKIGSMYAQTLFLVGLTPLIDAFFIYLWIRLKQCRDTGRFFRVSPD